MKCSKPCARDGCAGMVRKDCRSRLKRHKFCSHRCANQEQAEKAPAGLFAQHGRNGAAARLRTLQARRAATVAYMLAQTIPVDVLESLDARQLACVQRAVDCVGKAQYRLGYLCGEKQKQRQAQKEAA